MFDFFFENPPQPLEKILDPPLLNNPVEDSTFLLSLHIPDCVILLSEALFLRLNAVCLRLEISRGTTIAAEIGQAVIDFKLEVK